MKITLVTSTPSPKKAIAAAFLNMGIGRDIKYLEKDITDKEAEDAFKEIISSHLDAPLEFANFNLFWEDIPLFLRAQLVRHRVGWGFAERSMRFYDANLKSPVKEYDWIAMPTVTKEKDGSDKIGKKSILKGQTIQSVVEKEMERQLSLYSLLLEEGVDQQEARNIIGVWYPTSMQTTCSFRALRNMLADRLSSQAHPFWQKAAREIKEIITNIDKQMGDSLIDSCEMAGRCVWNSRFDRDCDACIARGKKKAHIHIWNRTTSFGPNTQCDCGIMKQNLIENK
jgi:flavin-dependent thymidylate synthase